MAAKQLGIDADRRCGGGGVVPCCGNRCGLFGTARTKNLCARCYRDHFNAVDKAAEAERARAATVVAGPETEKKKKAASTCSSCRRKVGLLGFACRCGGTFCSLHRHGDAHGCGFDFKRADWERIADENTAVVAPNITKICHSNY